MYTIGDKYYLTKAILKNDYSRLRKKIDRILGIRSYHKDTAEYAGKRLISSDEFNKMLSEKIMLDSPFMVARFGSNEMLNLIEFFKVKLGISKFMNPKLVNQLFTNAGVFPLGEPMAIRFCEIMLECMDEVDILGVWCSNCEDFVIRKYMQNTNITLLENLEPYYSKRPWSAALIGKKVLVIHPFEATIKQQFSNREHLFDGNVLPAFELNTLKAVQSIAGNNEYHFNDWEEALNYMYTEALKIDFEIAILGCGAYGFPLAAMLKKAGKKAIHLGGATQILFGIKGNRWDKIPAVSSLYNEYWIRPLECDIPKNAADVENACYW